MAPLFQSHEVNDKMQNLFFLILKVYLQISASKD